MPLHAYVGVNPALGQDVGGSQKAGKELQKAAGEETHCKFENAERRDKEVEKKETLGEALSPSCAAGLTSLLHL